MYEDDDTEGSPAEKASDPATRAQEKADEFRTHAELAAVFEGCRKFDAELRPGLDADLARDVQRTIAKLEKSRLGETPLILETAMDDAKRLLDLPKSAGLSTSDYHIHRRPGEVMILRLLAGDEVDIFYTRLQAHFEAALAGFRDDERNSLSWKDKDAQVEAYLDALDKITMNLTERYLREPLREHGLIALTTQSADELNINYLCDHLMGVAASDLVGSASAPPDEPTERDLAWFFKLFSLRGSIDGVERMCFFVFMQKADEGW